jgi:hypothetical protein
MEHKASVQSSQALAIITYIGPVNSVKIFKPVINRYNLWISSRNYLHQMIRTININEDVLITFQIVGDLCYAWEIVDYYTNNTHGEIKEDPSLAIKLLATFLKVRETI